MQRTRALIAENRELFPYFEYHYLLIDKALVNIKDYPDVSVESAKSLIEGVSKNIIKHLRKGQDIRYTEGLTLKAAFNGAMNELAEYAPSCEGSFSEELVKTISAVGEIRNKRGDVSHGHVSPKLEESSSQFAFLIVGFADLLTSYMLEVFYDIQFSDLEAVGYDDHPDFNNSIDEQYPLDDRVLYSRGLFDQYYEDYLIQLQDYEDQQDASEDEEEDYD